MNCHWLLQTRYRLLHYAHMTHWTCLLFICMCLTSLSLPLCSPHMYIWTTSFLLYPHPISPMPKSLSHLCILLVLPILVIYLHMAVPLFHLQYSCVTYRYIHACTCR